MSSLSRYTRHITNIDVFTALNGILFIGMCGVSYFDRFLHYRGREYLAEFFIYAIVILAAILIAWRIARRLTISTWLLVFLQIGILMHFSGGLSLYQGNRLYDAFFFGIRYDKYVHFVNAFLGVCILYQLPIARLQLKRWLADLARLLLVLGAGTIVEMVEYLVTLTVTVNGVGDYENNMQDLVANFLGASACILLARFVLRNRDA